MRLYLVRHGQSEGNVAKTFHGHTDYPLTELGREQARQAPTPFPTYSLFYNGAFVTHEILSEKKFEKLLLEKGL